MRDGIQAPALEIPFLDRFEKALRDGTKTSTARNKRYGHPGDRFTAFGMRFEITATRWMTLSDVANELWREEGVSSPLEFKEVWAQLHPRYGYKGHRHVWVHRFRRLP